MKLEFRFAEFEEQHPTVWRNFIQSMYTQDNRLILKTIHESLNAKGVTWKNTSDRFEFESENALLMFVLKWT